MKSRRSSAGLASFSGMAIMGAPFRLIRSNPAKLRFGNRWQTWFARREAGEPHTRVEEGLEVEQRPVLVRIDDQSILIDTLGLHIDGDGADRRDADQEVRSFDIAAQRLRDCERRLLDIDVRQATAIEPAAEPILSRLTL